MENATALIRQIDHLSHPIEVDVVNRHQGTGTKIEGRERKPLVCTDLTTGFDNRL